MSDKREFSRIAPEFDVVVLVDQNAEINGKASAISLKGLFFKGPLPIEKEKVFIVKIPLDEVRFIEAKGIVRRVTSEGSGIEFLELIGIDSWSHLKNLVAYNVTDKHSFLEELNQHIGLKKID